MEFFHNVGYGYTIIIILINKIFYVYIKNHTTKFFGKINIKEIERMITYNKAVLRTKAHNARQSLIEKACARLLLLRSMIVIILLYKTVLIAPKLKQYNLK